MSEASVLTAGGTQDPTGAFVAFVPDSGEANWSENLEELHEESSRDHFLDRYTRQAILGAITPALRDGGTVLDAGCSSGYLLADLAAVRPPQVLVGVDLVASGLRRAKGLVPSANLALADVCDLPVADGSVDAIVSSNLLEHVPDDRKALSEFMRVLKPGGIAAVVVPAGPGVYDYYDRFLSHERRYARRELSRKAQAAGFGILTDTYLGTLLFPPFWVVKKKNRRLHPNPGPDQIKRLVETDIDKTARSTVGRASVAIESRLLELGLATPFGIRSFVVMEKPA